MNKNEIVKILAEETKNSSEVKTIVHQCLIWPGFYEVRCFCEDGETYTALFNDLDEKLTSFEKAPVQQEKK